MNKREIIREGIADKVFELKLFFGTPRTSPRPEWCTDDRCKKYEECCEYCIADTILEYEDSQDVVIKGERELPEMPYGRASVLNPVQRNHSNKFRKQGYTKALQDMLRAGYVAVEPLIEEK